MEAESRDYCVWWWYLGPPSNPLELHPQGSSSSLPSSFGPVLGEASKQLFCDQLSSLTLHLCLAYLLNVAKHRGTELTSAR